MFSVDLKALLPLYKFLSKSNKTAEHLNFMHWLFSQSKNVDLHFGEAEKSSGMHQSVHFFPPH